MTNYENFIKKHSLFYKGITLVFKNDKRKYITSYLIGTRKSIRVRNNSSGLEETKSLKDIVMINGKLIEN